MFQPTTLLRSLGNGGAVANVRAVLDERRREEWIVESLLCRLDGRPLPSVPTLRPVRVA